MTLLVLDRPGLLTSAPDQTADQALAAVADILARLSTAGFTLVVASNEPDISTGELDLDQLEAYHARLSEWVENRGGTIAAFFYCPHTEADNCHCRKPKTGLIDAIELEFSTPANEMILLSDQPADFALAQTTGATAMLVLTERGKQTQSDLEDSDIPAFNGLRQVCEHLLTRF